MEGQSRDGEAIVFLLFSDIFVGRDEALMEGDKVMMGDTQVPPPTKTLWANIFGPRPFIVESLKEA